jgi:hypothetical protein
VVNSGHRDFVFAARNRALQLRYLVRLYVKELVLKNFAGLPADQLLERMIELSLYAEEKLKSGWPRPAPACLAEVKIRLLRSPSTEGLRPVAKRCLSAAHAWHWRLANASTSCLRRPVKRTPITVLALVEFIAERTAEEAPRLAGSAHIIGLTMHHTMRRGQ